MAYRIAEVAELTGLPASAIRYYEHEGMLRPADRAPNGYRSYRERDVERLRFVRRARNLDLSVADLRDLVELWDDEDCAVVADRMHHQVDQRLRETQAQIAELMALAGELQQVQTRLAGASHEGPCGDGCACVDPARPSRDLPLVPSAHADSDTVACTLAPDDLPQRVDDWQRVLAHATGREPIPDGTSLRFPVDTRLAGELVEIAAAEQGCCTFFTFTLRITTDALRLDVTAPPDAAPIVAAVFGPPGQASPSTNGSDA